MANGIHLITSEQIIADGEMVATFLRTLLAQRIPMDSAVTLSSAYLQSNILARNLKQDRPKDPWEGS